MCGHENTAKLAPDLPILADDQDPQLKRDSVISCNPQCPKRQIRALFDETTLTVYQAYPPQIADKAVVAGTLVPPFRFDRATWIKPSFLWMMYRSGWATKPGQERVLAIRISRRGFDNALVQACLTHYDPEIHISYDAWLRRKQARSVWVQWDPERSLNLDRLPWRTIQIGLSGKIIESYASEWIHQIVDVTSSAHDLHRLLKQGNLTSVRQGVPVEAPYPLPRLAAEAVGAVFTSPD